MAWSWGHVFSELSDLDKFVSLCSAGLQVGDEALGAVDVRRSIARALDEPDPFPSEGDYSRAKRRAEDISTFARERGRPYLFGTACIALWTVLEAAVDDLAMGLLRDSENWTDEDLIFGLKGPLLEFAHASETERGEFLCAAMIRSAACTRRCAVVGDVP